MQIVFGGLVLPGAPDIVIVSEMYVCLLLKNATV